MLLLFVKSCAKLYHNVFIRGFYMVFNFQWSDSKKGNYAIRRKHTNSKPAGKEIEPKNKTQTSATHLFILVDKNDTDSMVNLYRINQILKTITYDFRITGTDKKLKTPYLTKEDIEKVLSNIEQYKNETIIIKKASSPLTIKKGEGINQLHKKWLKIIKTIETERKEEHSDFSKSNDLKSIINNLIKSLTIKKQYEKKKLDTEKKIKQLKKDLLETELTINKEIELLEKMSFNIYKKYDKDIQYNSGEGAYNFQDYLEMLYPIAKKEKQRKERNKRQGIYRDRKNAKKRKT